MCDDLLSRSRPRPQQGQDTQASDRLLSLLPLLLFRGPQRPPLQTAKSQGLKAVAGSGVKGEVYLGGKMAAGPREAQGRILP